MTYDIKVVMGIIAGRALKLNFLDDPHHLSVWTAVFASQRDAIADLELITCNHRRTAWTSQIPVNDIHKFSHPLVDRMVP
jgi:hypothetical protein